MASGVFAGKAMGYPVIMLKDRLIQARKAKRLTQSEVARHVGISRNAVSLWESGDNEPASARLREVATLYGVDYDWLATGRGAPNGDRVPGLPVYGEIAAGVWSEVHESQDMDWERVPVAPDQRFPATVQYALRVRGNSVDQYAKDGAVVVCVDIFEMGMDVRDGDLVHAERRRGDLVETTLKRVRRNGNAAELWPVSGDPGHQKPIPLSAGSDTDSVSIKGLVIGVFTPIPRGS